MYMQRLNFLLFFLSFFALCGSSTGGSPRGSDNLHKKVHGNVSIRGGRRKNNEQKSAGGVGMRKATSVTPSPTKTEENKGIKSSGSRFFGWLRFF